MPVGTEAEPASAQESRRGAGASDVDELSGTIEGRGVVIVLIVGVVVVSTPVDAPVVAPLLADDEQDTRRRHPVAARPTDQPRTSAYCPVGARYASGRCRRHCVARDEAEVAGGGTT